MPVEVQCIQCKQSKKVSPYRAGSFKFCSNRCRGDWRKENWTGESHPNWQQAERVKTCKHCRKQFSQKKTEAISTFKSRMFCSKPCADIGGFRYTGENHPNYRKEARRKNRGGSHHKWVNAVVSRDKATCQECGVKGVELHAHHVKSYKDHPELRYDINNGLTLCYKCHWDVHSVENENGVNSGKILTGYAEDNPEPSRGGNVSEGVTTRGRVYRRWEGNCHWCGAFISKRYSDTKGKRHLFCSGSCATKHTRMFYHPRATKNRTPPSTAVIPPRAPCAKAMI